jgi:hypothetical protein
MYNKFNVIMVREESTNVSCNNSYAVAVSQRVGEIVDRRKSDMAAVAENRVARVGICGLYPMGGRAGARVQLPGSGYCGSGWDLGGIAARSVGSVQALSHGGGRAHRMWEMNIGIV